MTAPDRSESNQRVSGDKIAPASKSAEFRPEAPDLFNQLSLPLPQGVECAVCKTPFEIFFRRGRPQRFCGDECRRSEQLRQQGEWNARQKLNRQQGNTSDE